MSVAEKWLRGAVAVALVLGIVAPAGATTLVRADLEELVAANRTIVVGEVLDAHSYWNEDHSFILTDIRVATTEVLKGRAAGEVTVTLMGGTVGETTSLIVGGAVLLPGSSYVLFLNREDLPGVKALTVRDHVQGVFELVQTAQGIRAVSQANSHPLLPDKAGHIEPPGGEKGISLDTLIDDIRTIDRSQRQTN